MARENLRPTEVSIAEAEPKAGPQPRARSYRRLIRDVAETAIVILAIYTLVNLTTARYEVQGDSMEPNFHDGQRIIVSRIAYMLGDPERGDVIVFHYPRDPDRDFIKRVIGVPGDRVEIEGGQVSVNGQRLEEPYIRGPSRYAGAWALGPDEFFVLGDNRNNSNDSHDFGPIGRSYIVGRAWLIYWPPDGFGVVSHYDYAGD
ncbi:MAG: signal peptidase I [Anaerolineae bacterium]|nr:signal peptidase I [Anaerolineae bacterium]